MFILQQIFGADGTVQVSVLLALLLLPIVLWYVLVRASGILVAYCTPSSYYEHGHAAPLWKLLCSWKQNSTYLFQKTADKEQTIFRI